MKPVARDRGLDPASPERITSKVQVSDNPPEIERSSAPQAAASPRWRLGGARPGAGVNLAIFALVLAALAAMAAGLFWQRSDTASREAARRLQQGDARTGQLEAQLRQSMEVARDLQARSAVLESKLTEVLAQQAQLERLYQSIAQDGAASVLADVENMLGIASQQLAVSGNVRGAILALQDADARLKRINQPDAVGLRRLIARDLERLRAVPAVDVVALAVRLDAVASGIGQLPLVASLARPSPQERGSESGGTGGFSLERLAASGWRGWNALTAELSQLFRVSRVDAPDAMLLAPEQQYFARENLRMTLLSARLALLARAEPVYRSDLRRAIDWLATYYDRNSKAVASAMASLEQLESNRLNADLPSLGESMTAVRAMRAARERG